MRSRFEGENGEKNIVAALMRQVIVYGDQTMAHRLYEKGELVEKCDEVIITEGASDDDVYFILSGKADLSLKGKSIGERKAGDVVGDMSAIDPGAPRSATLKANGTTVLLKVKANDFIDILDANAEYWKSMYLMIADRLREREKFHSKSNETPILFIGCSVEGLPYAKELESLLNHSNVVTRCWYNNGVFGPSQYTMDDLESQLSQCDFAAFVFGPDDKLHSRGEDYDAPRDNVIFEMGLFIGRLGRDRVFMVKESGADLKIPSDLTGVKPVEFIKKAGATLSDMIGSVRNEIEEVIKTKGAS